MGFFDRLFKRKSLTLQEAVELSSIEIFASALAIVQVLIKKKLFVETLGTNPDQFNKAAWDLAMEFIILSLPLADRVAFSILGENQRSRFQDELCGSVISNLSESILREASPGDRLKFSSSVLELYNSRSQTLAQYRFPSKADENLGGTLFWEAAKLMAAKHLAKEEDLETIVLLTVLSSPSLIKVGNTLQKHLAAVGSS